MSKKLLSAGSLALIAAACFGGPASAQSYYPTYSQQPVQIAPQPQMDEQQAAPAEDEDSQMPARLQRQMVDYRTNEAPGTIIVDTPHTYLYLVTGNGKALRYGIGVGREGFTWSGVNKVARKAEWPDWYPPAEMIKRQPYLPRVTLGGPGNPLGARAMYIGSTEYRIHGTNDPTTIGKDVSSGCIRLTNEDVKDLYNRVQVGAKVIVLPQAIEARTKAPSRQAQQMAPQQVSMTQSYADSDADPAQRGWTTIR